MANFKKFLPLFIKKLPEHIFKGKLPTALEIGQTKSIPNRRIENVDTNACGQKIAEKIR